MEECEDVKCQRLEKYKNILKTLTKENVCTDIWKDFAIQAVKEMTEDLISIIRDNPFDIKGIKERRSILNFALDYLLLNHKNSKSEV